MSSKSVGVFQRCHTSNWMPAAGGSPASRRSSTVSGIELTIVQSSPPSRWYGSIPILRPSRCASAAIVAQAVDDDRARVVGVAPVGRAGQADEPAGAERREAFQRCAVRVDPLGRILGAAEERQRQDRRDRGNRSGRREPARLRSASSASASPPSASFSSQTPMPSRPGGRVCLHVVDEARPQRRDLGHGDARGAT